MQAAAGGEVGCDGRRGWSEDGQRPHGKRWRAHGWREGQEQNASRVFQITALRSPLEAVYDPFSRLISQLPLRQDAVAKQTGPLILGILICHIY